MSLRDILSCFHVLDGKLKLNFEKNLRKIGGNNHTSVEKAQENYILKLINKILLPAITNALFPVSYFFFYDSMTFGQTATNPTSELEFNLCWVVSNQCWIKWIIFQVNFTQQLGLSLLPNVALKKYFLSLSFNLSFNFFFVYYNTPYSMIHFSVILIKLNKYPNQVVLF